MINSIGRNFGEMHRKWDPGAGRLQPAQSVSLHHEEKTWRETDELGLEIIFVFFCSVNVLCDPKEITMDVSFGLFLWKEIQIDIQDAASGQCDCVFRPLALSREFPTRQDSQWLPVMTWNGSQERYPFSLNWNGANLPTVLRRSVELWQAPFLSINWQMSLLISSRFFMLQIFFVREDIMAAMAASPSTVTQCWSRTGWAGPCGDIKHLWRKKARRRCF